MILVINAGSSSIKFGLYAVQNHDEFVFRGQVDAIGSKPSLSVLDNHSNVLMTKATTADNHQQALEVIFQEVEKLTVDCHITAVGHRVVHGGKDYTYSVVINDEVMADLERLIPLASLHSKSTEKSYIPLQAQHNSKEQIQ